MNDLDDVEEADTLAVLLRPSRRSAQSRVVVVDLRKAAESRNLPKCPSRRGVLPAHAPS